MNESIVLIHDVLWSPAVLWGMLLFGSYLLVRLGFLPFRWHLMKQAVKAMFSVSSNSDGLSGFQILATNLGAVMGIGNLVGVASALMAGGPGALLWMCMSSILISSLKYGEILLALKYRKQNRRGGPMYYIREGIGSRYLAKLYAWLLVLSSFGIGNMVASRSMADALASQTGIPPWIWGFCIMGIMIAVVMGGGQRVVKVCTVLVPFLVLGFCVAGTYVMIREAHLLSYVIRQILKQAFAWRSAAGGMMGLAMKYGMSRGIFSNEAGMGSATLTHVQSDHSDMVLQAMAGFWEVFLDTVLMCSLTGFVILLSQVPLTMDNPVTLMMMVFVKYFGAFGSWLFTLSLVLFGLASVMGWFFYGQRAVDYVLAKGKRLYPCLFVLFLFLGTLIKPNQLWLISDEFNGLLLWINVLTLFVMRKEIIEVTRVYLRKRRC